MANWQSFRHRPILRIFAGSAKIHESLSSALSARHWYFSTSGGKKGLSLRGLKNPPESWKRHKRP